jgi:MFS family permease
VNSVDIPTRQAFLVDMVGRDDLMNAIALNSSMFNGARIVGPAVAGILVATIGEGWCFFVNAVSFVAVIAGLLLMRLKRFERVETNVSALGHLMEGFRYVRGTAPIRALLAVVGVSSLLGLPVLVLMPLFADRVLHGGARGLGWLMGAVGIGALLGALTLAMRRGVHGLGRVVAWAAGGFGASLLLFSLSRNLVLSMLMLVPVGFCMLLQNSSANTLIQTMVPDRLRGRVMSVYAMTFLGFARRSIGRRRSEPHRRAIDRGARRDRLCGECDCLPHEPDQAARRSARPYSRAGHRPGARGHRRDSGRRQRAA